MCTNFLPAVQLKYLRSMFGVDIPDFEFHPEAYPGYGAPIVRNIIRQSGEEPPRRECIAARFGLVPSWSRPEDVEKPTKRFATHNARLETVGQLPSYKHAWHNSQRCLIPVEAFFEPCWETGKAVRWKMTLRDGHVFALAGIWERWYRDGKEVMSFSMLTVNADDHAIMKRMHRPGDEKRMPVIIRQEDYDRWLGVDPEVARRMCQTFPADEMIAEPAPKPAKIAKSDPGSDDLELLD
ncbi:MAG: SOS response-associated peptidase [Betaproteobacteria bacterium]|nr:SOS response-associated peptidase [Betaproteobacteria bacterium]